MANAMLSPTTTTTSTSSAASTAGETPPKRHKTTHHHHHQQNHHNQQPLLPGLPDHIARLCLSRAPSNSLYSVCRSWRRLIYAPSFPPFLSLYALLSPIPSPSSSPSRPHQFLSEPDSNKLEFHCFDPLSCAWHALPPLPPDPPLRLLLRHPSFLSFNFPIQSVSISGNLVLLAATSHDLFPALIRPLIFNPLSGSWSQGPPPSTPRRWCAAGACRGAVYIASGIGSHFCTDVARSLEKWELKTLTPRQQHDISKLAKCSHNSSERNAASHSIYGSWQKLSCLKDGRFCREAIDAVGWRGKLCMVNVKGDASKEGILYDVVDDKWDDMPEGMIGGWKGPVASMDEDVMFSVDETKGLLRKYDEKRDVWEDIMKDERLKGCQQIAAGGGRVCAVCGGGGKVLVVDVVAEMAIAWEVETPEGFQAVSIHVLPRMNGPDSFGGF